MVQTSVVVITTILGYCISIATAEGLDFGKSESNSMEDNGGSGGRSRRALSSYSFSREPIPGSDLKTGTFYVVRMKKFPSGVVSWSTKKHFSGYNYVFVDNAPGHRDRYRKGGEWYKDTQWAFLTSKEPGWYHLINRAIPCQYSSWSDSETIDGDGTFYMTIDPNYPGTHSEDDFLFKPYQPSSEAVDQPYYQLKLKSMQNAVISWNAGNSSNDAFYIHLETADDANWMKRYSWGHIWYDDTLFSFEEVSDKDEERVVEEEGGENSQRQFDTLVGQVGYDYSKTSTLDRVGCTFPLILTFLTVYIFHSF